MKPDRLADPATKNYFRTQREDFTTNESGIEPVSTKVLVLTDSIGDTTGSGLLHLPADVAERMTLAITTGVLAAAGGAAFTDWPNSDRQWPGVIPQVGNRIHLARYAGIIIEGKDGKRYRLCQDTDIAGIETGDAKPQVFATPQSTN